MTYATTSINPFYAALAKLNRGQLRERHARTIRRRTGSVKLATTAVSDAADQVSLASRNGIHRTLEGNE